MSGATAIVLPHREHYAAHGAGAIALTVAGQYQRRLVTVRAEYVVCVSEFLRRHYCTGLPAALHTRGGRSAE